MNSLSVRLSSDDEVLSALKRHFGVGDDESAFCEAYRWHHRNCTIDIEWARRYFEYYRDGTMKLLEIDFIYYVYRELVCDVS